MEKFRGNPKKHQIVTTAMSLFWKFGIRRVAIEEICRAANVSKMTFYKYFSNKIELVKFIIDNLTDEAVTRYQQIMSQDLPFKDKVQQSIEFKMKQTDHLSQDFLDDIYHNIEPELREYFNRKAHEGIQIILDDYVKAQRQGDIRPGIKPEFIHYFMNHMLEMVHDEKLVQLYETPQQLIMELTNFFFYGILPGYDNKRELR